MKLIVQLCEDCDPANSISKKYLQWLTSSPLYKKGCLHGIRLSSSKKLVWASISLPYKIRIGGNFLSMVHLQYYACSDAEHRNHFHNIGTKEIMRILRGEGIFQATMITVQRVIPKSVVVQDIYLYDLRSHSLPHTTRTVGLRRMTPSDVPKAFALTDQYTSV